MTFRHLDGGTAPIEVGSTVQWTIRTLAGPEHRVGTVKRIDDDGFVVVHYAGTLFGCSLAQLSLAVEF